MTTSEAHSSPGFLRGQLAADIPALLPDELFGELIRTRSVRIERIVSRGHASPPGFWYEQEEHELVLLLTGAARLELEGQGELALAPLDWLNIPARMRHRVTFTDPEVDSVWLAVFYRD